MIIKEIEILLTICLKDALVRRHEYILLEHLLYQICSLEEGRNIFDRLGKDTEALKEKLNSYLNENVSPVKLNDKEPLTSVMVERVINRAIQKSIANNEKACQLNDILLSILEESDSYAAYLLKEFNLTKNNFKKIDLDSSVLMRLGEKEGFAFAENNYQKVQKPTNPLPHILVSMEEKIKESFDSLVGRKKELGKIYQVLAQRKKNNPLLLGEAGVGKTALVEGMAFEIHHGRAPAFFKDEKIYSLQYNFLMAGTKYRGELEERFKKIFNFIKAHGQIILFIDDVHVLLSSNAANTNQSDCVNLLKNFLNDEKIKCIATTSYQEYHNQQNKEASFFRRFQTIDIKEPSLAETETILLKIKNHYEKFHEVSFSTPAIKKIVELTRQYLPEKKLPDGAIDLMDFSGARWKIKNFTTNQQKRKIIDEKNIEENVSEIKGFPLKKVEKKHKIFFKDLEKKLKSEIFGQKEAIELVLRALKLAQAGLLDDDKTLGAFLLAGPTGVGKTELCRVLAREMPLHLIRLDMSEYMEAHSIAKLIGAPPGYVGYNEKKNELTEQVKKNPHSLILLDEIEKAHHDVINAFLQVMDYGTLTDSQGNKVDFKNSLIIMTSNLGALEYSANPVGFGDKSEKLGGEKAISNFFSPEFRNRLSAVVKFNSVTPKIAKQVVMKFVKELNALLKKKKTTVKLSEKALNYLISKGITKKMGARPLKRLIEKEIKERIVDELIDDNLKPHSTIHFDLRENELFYQMKLKN